MSTTFHETATVEQLEARRNQIAAVADIVDVACDAIDRGQKIDEAALHTKLFEHGVTTVGQSVLDGLWNMLAELRDTLTDLIEARQSTGTDAAVEHRRLLRAAENAAATPEGAGRASVLLDVADRWARIHTNEILTGSYR